MKTSKFMLKLGFGIKKFLVSLIPNKRKRNSLMIKLAIEKSTKLNPANFLDCKVGRNTYAGKNVNVLNSETTIGSFCSFSQNIMIGPAEHPLTYLSTSPCFYTCLFGWKKRKNEVMGMRPCHVGNDVWVGCNVFIKEGVTIGDGAAIGAGAVVVKDVPPYAVVGGVPAKVIKYRFDEKTIKELLELKWWELDDNIIEEVPFEDINEEIKFLKEIKRGKNA